MISREDSAMVEVKCPLLKGPALGAILSLGG